ncbi:MAG: hypothetical protein PF569_06105 [Candidatus Woesearchaeota archaeon]|jgi:hypothetical protein|nr:hypothetical protein [Candidatus Woesearchaeota archaeon]
MENNPILNTLQNPEYDFSFVLNKTVELTKKYIKEILIIALISTILSLGINSLTHYINNIIFTNLDFASMEAAEILEYFRIHISELVSYIFFIITIIIVSLIVNLLLTSTLIFYINNDHLNNKISLNDSFLKAIDKIWILLLTQIIFGIFVFGLSLLFIIPGIIFAVYWGLYLYAVIIRDKDYTQALKYSKDLIKENWWRTVGYSFVILLIIEGIQFILGLFLIPLYFALAFIKNYYIQQLLILPSTFISTAVGFIFILYGITYFKVLEKEKGIENELE